MKRKILFRYLFWVLENTREKYFQYLVMHVKAFFQKKFSYIWPLNVKYFIGKCQKNIPILQLSISKYLYTSYMHIHYIIPITKKYEHIHIQVLCNNDRGTPTYKNHNPNTTFMVIHPSLDVPFYWAHHQAGLAIPLRLAFLHSTLQSSMHGSTTQLRYLIDISINRI